MSLKVKVKNGEFDPRSQTGIPGDTVKFENDRSSEVTITLDPAFYSEGTLKVGSGKTKDVTILPSATGTGGFSAPQVTTAKLEPIRGEIIITTK